MMLEHLEGDLAEQRASLAGVYKKLLASRFASGRQKRVSRYLTAAMGMTEKPLRLSIVGELNAGKTELANLILGVQFLPSSIINNTLCPTVIRYGEPHAVRYYRDKTGFAETDSSDLHKLVQREGFLVECALPLPMLRSVEIADLPSFENIAFDGGHVASLLCRSDVLIWCSRATRAWTASEKSVWLQMPKRLKANCLFVLTHADKLNADALKEVMGRVRAEILSSGGKPVYLATPLAIAARSPRGQIMNPKLWASSGGERFFKKLSDLLQTALGNRQNRIEKNANRILSSVLENPVSGDGGALMREWLALAPFFEIDPGAASSEQAGTAAVEAIARFKRDYCEPWLRLHNRREDDIEALLSLFPESVAELTGGSKHRLSGRLPLIFQQLTAEIEEYRPPVGR